MSSGDPAGFRPPRGARYPRQARVTKGPEIRAVLARGRRVRTDAIDVYVLPTTRTRPRLGFIVPKARHSAVERNRLKRRLKEIGRVRVLGALFRACPSVDVLVRARPAAYRASWEELNVQFLGVVEGLCSQNS